MGPLTSVILGVVSNVLTMFLVRPFSADETKPPSLSSILEGAIDDTADSFEWIGPPRLEEVCLFLATPEVEAVVRQVFSVKLVQKTNGTIESIREEFVALFARYFELNKPQLPSSTSHVFTLLLDTADKALKAAIERGVLVAHEAMSVVRYRQLHDEIAAIQKNLALLTSRHKPNLKKILTFEEKYRSQVAERHGRITPPNFDSARKLPIDEIYVAPDFIEFCKEGDRAEKETTNLGLSAFFSRIYRAVLVGNPGGGKSTLKDKLCFDLASRYAERLLAGRTLTPIPVILRDYGSEKKTKGCSIVQFIESTANSNYQIEAPKGAFEYLLLNGRVIVIFDGLDELLETSYRQQITADVESFCNLYPSVPVLVTSREVGYEQAPLDDKKFATYKLAPFNENQISEYVTKWFLADSDLTSPQRQQKTKSFLKESSIVPDLRSNPLMLALMCNIYRGENYIPQNRPDLYEKCAVMLFERWDKNRGIIVPLPFEAHIKPAMMFLAHWIYTNSALQSGVDEASLINKTTDYLLERRYDDRDEAEFAAREFIEFCKGRAWVFTDTGAGLYQFTHRTFLEYFTSFHLVRKHSSPSALLEVLIDRISKQEWDIVAQLSIQLLNKHSEGAGDEVLRVLAKTAEKGEGTDLQAWNLIHFACRCLNFIVPSSAIRKLITTVCLDRYLKLGRLRSTQSNGYDPRRISHYDREPIHASLAAILNVFSENQPTIVRVVEEWLIDKLQNGTDIDASLAVEILTYLPYAFRYPHYDDPGPERRAFWKEFTERVYEACKIEIRQLAKKDRVVCNIVFWRREFEITDFISLYGIEGAFINIPYRIFPMMWSAAPQLLGSVLFAETYAHITTKPKETLIEYDHQQLQHLGDLLLQTPTPWLEGRQEDFFDLSRYLFDQHYSESSLVPIKLTPKSAFGAFAVIAVGLEAVSLRKVLIPKLLAALEKSSAIICESLRWSLLARFRAVDEAAYLEELNKIGFERDQRAFIIGWIRRDINLIRKALPKKTSRGSTKSVTTKTHSRKK
jgi:hypothetical protein